MPDLSLIPAEFRLPTRLWEQIRPLLPVPPPRPKGGRPRADDRRCLEGVYYLARTGAQWRALPRCFGPKSTVHDRYQQWVEAGLFEQMWRRALEFYDDKTGLNWAWQSMDGSMTKAPLGGEATGPNPTDRGKLGVKRSLLTEGRGIPVAIAVAPANRTIASSSRRPSMPVWSAHPARCGRGSASTRGTITPRSMSSWRRTPSRDTPLGEAPFHESE